MANPLHLQLVKQGTAAVDAWRAENPDVQLDLSYADLAGIDLQRVDLGNANLGYANLSGARLSGAYLARAIIAFGNLSGADLSLATLEGSTLFQVDFTSANLSRADLSGAVLVRACFTNADLRGADLHLANLSSATFQNADMTAANLMRAVLTEVVLEGATLNEARVYGVSVWDVRGEPREQRDLDISPVDHPPVTVDYLLLAQFISLLSRNERIRDVIDAVTSKVVLILGRFSATRKPVLDGIRNALRSRNLVPVLFDFDRPVSKDVTGTIETVARMARFIIADLTDPSSVPHELATIVPMLRTTPVLPLRSAGSNGYGMFNDLLVYPWVLPVHEYADGPTLLSELEEVIAPAVKKAAEFRS